MSGGLRTLLAVMESGFESAGMVMGAVAYQIQQMSPCFSPSDLQRELPACTYYESSVRGVWRTAVERLEEEAARRGAHGVVGVWASNQSAAAGLQISLIGTAVRVPGVEPLGRPFLSKLSMDDTLKLLRRGWVPAGIGFGFSAVHVHGWSANPLSQGTVMTNAEMNAPSQGMFVSRRRAEADLRASLGSIRSEGVLASEISLRQVAQRCTNGQGVMIEGQMLGTAVVHYRDPVIPLVAVRNLTKAGRS